MCRLYAFRASHPTRAACALADAPNALERQSRCDRRGLTHPDGWGLGHYDEAGWRVERQATAAFDDPRFADVAHQVCTTTLIAHVRQASVGTLRLENTHPFTFGRWLFAHNGTIPHLDKIAPRMSQQFIPAVHSACRGDTDSERLFYWLLSRLHRDGVDLTRGANNRASLMHTIGDGLRTLADWCDQAAAEERGGNPQDPVKLNILLSDGDWLVASRWNHALHWAEIVGKSVCRHCGVAHTSNDTASYRAVLVASEPASDAPWTELPDRSLLCIGPDAYVDFHRLT